MFKNQGMAKAKAKKTVASSSAASSDVLRGVRSKSTATKNKDEAKAVEEAPAAAAAATPAKWQGAKISKVGRI